MSIFLLQIICEVKNEGNSIPEKPSKDTTSTFSEFIFCGKHKHLEDHAYCFTLQCKKLLSKNILKFLAINGNSKKKEKERSENEAWRCKSNSRASKVSFLREYGYQTQHDKALVVPLNSGEVCVCVCVCVCVEREMGGGGLKRDCGRVSDFVFLEVCIYSPCSVYVALMYVLCVCVKDCGFVKSQRRQSESISPVESSRDD